MSEFRRVDPHKFDKKVQGYNLNTNLISASLMSSYSLCIEFVKNWFLSAFDEKFFTWVHVNDANVVKEAVLDRSRIVSHLDANSAQLTITPTIDEDFNRENEDNGYGLKFHLRRNPLEATFWDDWQHNRHISIEMHQISMQFEFKITVHSRAQQLDILQYIKEYFNTGYTQSFLVDQDFYLPKKLTYCIAEDQGYKLMPNGDLSKEDAMKMMYYMNAWSRVPILYKVRTVTGHPEFFARFPEIIVHLTKGQVNKDDGNKFNHLSDAYNITFNVAAEMAAPKFFQYHTVNPMSKFPPMLKDETMDKIIVESIPTSTIPEANHRGWLLYVKDVDGLYEEDLTKPLEVNFEGYFEGEISRMVHDHLARGISPNLFMDLRIYNNFGLVKGSIDWKTFTFKSEEPLKNSVNSIAVYMDMVYMNSQRIAEYNMGWNYNRQGNVKENNLGNP